MGLASWQWEAKNAQNCGILKARMIPSRRASWFSEAEGNNWTNSAPSVRITPQPGLNGKTRHLKAAEYFASRLHSGLQIDSLSIDEIGRTEVTQTTSAPLTSARQNRVLSEL
ncbi:MAG: hypothetical protein DWH78_10110 [Planctomycetota bacterium]|nr:MAG: hypothetical protein DWH78_10110 [Planctomycetota bacterium]